MPEDSGEVTSKAFGVIPYLFFDLIARVAPGLLLLFGINLISGRQVIGGILEFAFPDPELRKSPTAWLVVLLVTAYILGQAISPIVKLLDKENKEVAQKYNDLRNKVPGVTSILMRIRAEYIMYGGFAVALMVILGLVCVYRLFGVGDWYKDVWMQAFKDHKDLQGWALLLGVAVAIALMIYRNQMTIKTYENTVRELHVAAGLSNKTDPETRSKNLIDRTMIWFQKTWPKKPEVQQTTVAQNPAAANSNPQPK